MAFRDRGGGRHAPIPTTQGGYHHCTWAAARQSAVSDDPYCPAATDRHMSLEMKGVTVPVAAGPPPPVFRPPPTRPALSFFLPQVSQVDLYDEEGRRTRSTILPQDNKVWLTYVLTIAQIAVCILQITGTPVVPGSFARWGMGIYTEEAVVPRLSGNVTLSIQLAENPYFGPKTHRIVQWGAKYAPCMRQSPTIKDKMDDIETSEASFGCCVVDGDCGLKNETKCAEFSRSTFWGQGSRCNSSCNIVLRPCCYGVTYTCEVIRKEYCNELEGNFHAEEQGCANINCLNGICGLGANEPPKGFPSQAERFFLPIWLHAGVIHCAMNMLVQWQLGKELEKVAGWWRFFIMYFGSGIGGNIFAAVFVPDQISVGASSAIYGLFGVDFVLLFHLWKITENKYASLCCSTVSLILYLGIGTLPWIDNWAHVGGFLTGLLLANIFLPYFSWAGWKRGCGLIFSIALLIIAVAVGLSLFYANSDPEFCSWCKYVSCIPYTSGLCDSTETS